MQHSDFVSFILCKLANKYFLMFWFFNKFNYMLYKMLVWMWILKHEYLRCHVFLVCLFLYIFFSLSCVSKTIKPKKYTKCLWAGNHFRVCSLALDIKFLFSSLCNKIIFSLKWYILFKRCFGSSSTWSKVSAKWSEL